MIALLLVTSASARAQVTAFDSHGNVYIGTSPQSAGETISPGAFQSTFVVATCTSLGVNGSPSLFPCSHGYVSKVSPDGSKILIGTYLGGSSGDFISAIALDRAGNIYVAGGTSSSDFPITADAYQRIPGPNFLSVLSPDGKRLLHSTFLNFAFSDSINAIAIDPQGHVLVAGSATANDFPASFPVQSNTSAVHPFLAAFSPQLSELVNAIAIDPVAVGGINAMAMDGSANVYMTGTSVTNNKSQIFLTKLNDSGSELWSFHFGGSNSDTPYTLSIDDGGRAYITGNAISPDFPVTPGAYQAASPGPLSQRSQGFATKVSADGSHIMYSALLPDIGGPVAAALSTQDELMVAAEFVSYFTNFPSTPSSSQPCLNAAQSQSGGAGVFLALSTDGSHLTYATVLPSNHITLGMTNWLLALQSNGHIYVGSQTRQFDIVDTNARPSPGVTCIANAASYRSGAIAPEEIVSLFGASIGPAQPVVAHATNGLIGSTLAGVQVQFNGTPAPLIYVSEDQINAVVPFEIAGLDSVTVQVVNQETKLPPMTVPVTPSAPGIFTLDASGAGQAAVMNQDGSVNSSENPAPPGSTITVFVTGAGQTAPTPKDGSLGNGKTKPVLPISGELALQPLITTYVGDVPGTVQGMVQVKCVVPPALTPGAYPLSISFGSPGANVAEQAAVYVSVQ